MELMESIKGNDPNNAGCAHHVPPSRSNSGADLPAPPPKPDPAAEVPKKKARAAKPQARNSEIKLLLMAYLYKPLSINILCQGSELELELLPDTDIKAFISTWVTACTTAEGRATTTTAELRRCK